MIRLAFLLSALVFAPSASAKKLSPEYQALFEELQLPPPELHDLSAEMTDTQPIPWEVGQFAVYRRTDKKGRISVERLAVVKKDDCGLWVETVTQDDKHHSVQKICYSAMPKVWDTLEETTARAFELVQVMIQETDGKNASVIDFRTPEGQMMRQTMAPILVYAIQEWQLDTSGREDVTVPAGTFKGAIKTRFDVKILFIRAQGEGFVHPGVPLNGSVSMKSSDGSKSELVNFGMTGGPQSELPAVWSTADL